MPVNIHGKQYITVAERLVEAREHIKSINTEVIPNGGAIVIKATVTTDKGVFTGISAANSDKTIEKQSPYEVAETSAVGRALGFAGYGVIDSIASADEMVKSTTPPVQETEIDQSGRVNEQEENFCNKHNIQMKERFKSDGTTWYDHRHQVDGEWETCYGKGYPSETA